MLVDCESYSKQLEESSIFERDTATHTFADVLWESQETALPPFEYRLSTIPPSRPRMCSIASLDLVIVLDMWDAPHQSIGLVSIPDMSLE
jgi:hypothetical protein